MRWLRYFGVIFLILAAPISARDYDVYTTTTPMVYQYAACAFALDHSTAEQQIDSCKSLREKMSEAAEEILPRFNPRERSDALRNLQWAFDDIEHEANLAREQRKTVPPSIIAYLECMGGGVMATEGYQQGIAVDFIGIEELCVEKHVLSVTFVKTAAELERIKILYQRFARNGRFVDNRRLGSGVQSTGDFSRGRGGTLSRSSAPVMPVYLMDQGFLLLHRLPPDENPE